jgi:diguanylate cyclase (GGDEF)-like protein
VNDRPGIQTDIADPALRGAFVLVRWLLLLVYVPLVYIGVLPVGHAALLASSGILASYFALLTALELGGYGTHPAVAMASRYGDIVGSTVVLVTLHSVTTPIWAVYFLTMVGSAHFLTKPQMALFVAWTACNFAGAAAITALTGHDVPWGYAGAIELILIGMGTNATLLAGGQQRLRDVLTRAASTDSLTGIANRRSFQATFAGSLRDAIARIQPLAFMLIDVDHFKEINDLRGHPAGDDKLRDVARALNDGLRAGDVVARFGGDEFSVVAPHASRTDALTLAERLRAGAASCGASVSIGLATFPDDAETEDALIDAADRALYAAKEAGRNCVRLAA